MPTGFGVVLDVDTAQLDSVTLFGGAPSRMMRLSAVGLFAWGELQRGMVCSAAGGALARRLIDAGLAHPRPLAAGTPMSVDVIIPVRDRPEMLARCLSALDTRYRVIVVDDGSDNRRAIAAVAGRHGAILVRRDVSGGPGAARNTGLTHATADVVAFLDSDCVSPPEWIERLGSHLADPLVAAVAPRIAALPSASAAGRYGAARGSLDLGDREARVVPGTRVSYVPTAALLVRRAALMKLSDEQDIFDPTLRYGEDVDLIWRLHDAGWRVRYDPSVTVAHEEPRTWIALLRRRFRFGTSAAPLAQRHPADVAPLVLRAGPALTVAALLAGRPAAAAGGLAASVVATRRSLSRANVSVVSAPRATLTAISQTWLGVARYSTQFASPALAALLVAPSGSKAHRVQLAATALLLAGPLTTWRARRPALDPLRFTLAHVADDVAYGAGVYAGCAQFCTATPLRPRIARRPVRTIRIPKGSSDGE